MKYAGPREALIQSAIMAQLNSRTSPCRVWRNNVGCLQNIHYGLGKGSADLVGLVKTTGQFLAVEVKTPIGRVSPEQAAWLEAVRGMGGLAFVWRSVDEATAFVETLRKSNGIN